MIGVDLHSLLALALATWTVRQAVHRVLHYRSLKRAVLFRARVNRVQAWMLYIPQLALMALAADALLREGSSSVLAVVGLALAILGSLLVIGALVQLDSSYSEELEIRTGYSHVSNGLFALTKHPMRWGLLLEAAGFAFIAGSIPAAIIFFILIGLIVVRNRDEEAMLSEFRDTVNRS